MAATLCVRSKVSVVIPCFNAADTLTRAMDSVVKQTWLPGEVILVDDASTDRTLRVIQQVAAAHEPGWIKIIQLKKNIGPGAARNAGWAVARSPYLAFLDADDTWHPRKLELQSQWMERHPDVAFSGHLMSLDDGRPWELQECHCQAKNVGPMRLLFSNPFLTPTVMVRRDLPMRFDPEKRHCEDYLLWLQLVFAGQSGVLLPLSLARGYKPFYGASGLSGNLWVMERGQLENYAALCSEGRINRAWWTLVVIWSLLRFLRRIVVTSLRSLPMRRDATASE